MTFILQELNTDNTNNTNANDIDKLLKTQIGCSHLVLNCTKSTNCTDLQTYEDLFIKLYKFKVNNRHIKTLLYISSNILHDLKGVIYTMTYYGFDGLHINIINSSNLKPLKKLITLLTKLPEPYNTKWDLFLTIDNTRNSILNIDYVNNYVDGYITNITSNDIIDISTSKLLICQQKEDVYYNCILTCIDKGLAGVYLPYEVDYRYFLPLQFIGNNRPSINRITFPSSYFISKICK